MLCVCCDGNAGVGSNSKKVNRAPIAGGGKV